MIKRWIQDWLGLISDDKVAKMMKEASYDALREALRSESHVNNDYEGYLYGQIKRITKLEALLNISTRVDTEIESRLDDEKILDNIVKRLQDKQL